MSDTATDDTAAAEPKRRSRKTLPLALLGAVVLGGAGFYGMYAGLIPLPEQTSDRSAPGLESRDVAHVALGPLLVNVGSRADGGHLRFAAKVETSSRALREVSALEPRFSDILNSYLRALEPHELQDPAALMRLRAQLLRRFRMVAGEDQVLDLLITEFVLN